MEQRYQVAQYLDAGLIYNDILEKTGASSATISRVNRSLIYGNGGYESVLEKMKEKEGKLSCYEALASSYDALTEDVGYEKRADFLEKLFRRSRIPGERWCWIWPAAPAP